jgi:hypothetical protein
MNKRYEQLLAQARIVPNPPGTYRRYDNILPEQMGKFAELIVRECLNQCYNRGMNDELYAGQLKAATYIEEHFGVEEK